MKEKKRMCFMREILFFKKRKKKRKIFSEKNEIKQTKGLFVRKNSWIEWKRMKKEEKRKIFPGKICEGEW